MHSWNISFICWWDWERFGNQRWLTLFLAPGEILQLFACDGGWRLSSVFNIHVNQQTADMGRSRRDKVNIWIGTLPLLCTPALSGWIVRIHHKQHNDRTCIGLTSPLARAAKTGNGHWTRQQNRGKTRMTVINWMKVGEELHEIKELTMTIKSEDFRHAVLSRPLRQEIILARQQSRRYNDKAGLASKPLL